MSGDPYRRSAEPVDEVYDDFEPFRRALAWQRQRAFVVVGYVLALIVDFIAMPLLSPVETIAVITSLGIGALGLLGKFAGRNAS